MVNQRQQFVVNPPNELNAALGFQAVSVRADNPTQYYYYLPDAGAFIPPYTFGAVYLLAQPSQAATVKFVAPNGIQQFNPATGLNLSPVTLSFSDDLLAPNPGINVPQPTAGRLFTFTTLSGSGSATDFLINSPSTKPFLFLQANAGNSLAVGIKVNISFSGNPYWQSGPIAIPGWNSGGYLISAKSFSRLVLPSCPANSDVNVLLTSSGIGDVVFVGFYY